MRRPEFLSAAAILFFIATGTLSFGWDYLVENQNTYLVHAFRLIDPAFLGTDWFATETRPYHGAFPYLIYLLAALGPLAWTTGVLNSLLIALSLAALWVVLGRESRREQPAVFGLIVAVFILGETRSVAGSYILSSYLQPSSLGGAGFMLGIAAFVTGRYSLAGVFLAAGGLFHANYLLLSFPVFASALLFLGREKFWRRTAAVLLPPTVVLLANLPILLDVASDPLAQEGARIFTQIRAPWHYRPTGFLRDFLPLLGWGWTTLLCFRSRWLKEIPWRGVVALAEAIALCVAVVTVLTTAIYLQQAAQLFFWRLAPFFVLLASLLCAKSLFEEPLPHHPLGRMAGGVLLLAGLAVLKAGTDLFVRFGDLYILAGILILFILRLARDRIPLFRDSTRPLLRWTAIGLAGVVALQGASGQMRQEFAANREISDEDQLYRFAAATPPESLFLIPPGLEDFRLGTGRAVVVDWKSTPYRGTDLVRWYRRISDISGRPVNSLEEARKGYSNLDPARLRRLSDTYGPSHLVLYRTEAAWHPAAAPLFENRTFLVYSLPEEGRR